MTEVLNLRLDRKDSKNTGGEVQRKEKGTLMGGGMLRHSSKFFTRIAQ